MMSAWEAQQRAQKEQERKAKMEAAAALQSYRRSGLSEEEMKLAALREQDRLQKQSAAEQLRGYRGQLSEEEARLAAQKQEELRRKQATEEQLRNNGVVSAQDPTARNESILRMKDSGTVSELAAGYTSPQATHVHASSPTASASLGTMGRPAQPDFSVATIGREATDDSAGYPMTLASPVRSKAMFMFGILTSKDVDTASSEERSRLVSRYLARADEIARSVIDISPSYQSIRQSLEYPIASTVVKDRCEY